MPTPTSSTSPIRIMSRQYCSKRCGVDCNEASSGIEPTIAGCTAATDNRTTIRLAMSLHDLKSVYGFRYEVYVEEMGRRQQYADHLLRRITDPLDETGYTLAAWRDGQVVATVRNNHFDEDVTSEYRRLYRISPFESGASAALTTRLMVAPAFRRGTTATRICMKLYEEALLRGVETAYLDCNSHLIRYFNGLGYRTHIPEVEHVEYGTVTVMRLDLLDLAHLNRVRSPFRRICSEYLNSRSIES